MNPTSLETINLFLNFLIVIAPFVLAVLAFNQWMAYRRIKYIYYTFDPVLLELRLPPQVDKTPRAMELVFNAAHQASVGSLTDVYWRGRIRPYFSFELVSINGDVHFYIWTPSKFKKILMTELYAQYPEIEIFEAEDYATRVQYDPTQIGMWGAYFDKTFDRNNENDEVIPIRTYTDYGLHMNPKEEQKLDPLVSVIEYMGNLTYGEQAWLQIVIEPDKADDWKNGNLIFSKGKDYKKKIDEYIEGIKNASRIKYKDQQGAEHPGLFVFEPGTEDFIKQLRGFQGKYAFRTQIRGIYLSQHDTFNGTNIPGLIGVMRQFSSVSANGFRPADETDLSNEVKAFLDMFPLARPHYEKKKAENEEEFLEVYKMRTGFYQPHKGHGPQYLLNTEELATLYHIVGPVAATPTLDRVESRKDSPPANLPV